MSTRAMAQAAKIRARRDIIEKTRRSLRKADIQRFTEEYAFLMTMTLAEFELQWQRAEILRQSYEETSRTNGEAEK